MDDSEFFDRLKLQLGNIVEEQEFQERPGKAFVFWIGNNFFNLDDDDECLSRICDGSNDEGIDAVFVDENEKMLYIVNATTVDAFKSVGNNLPESDVKNLALGFDLVTYGDYRGKVNPILEDLAAEYHEYLNTGDYRVTIVLFYLMQDPLSLKYMKELQTEHDGIEVKLINFDSVKAIFEESLTHRKPPPDKVTVNVMGQILKPAKVPRALIFSISGSSLADLYFVYGNSLFQRNIRYFLPSRAKSINSQIQKTASSDTESGHFWYYNNGITVVCSRFEVTPNDKVVVLERPQIINGAQTTRSLFEVNQRKELKDNVDVLFKVIESDDEDFMDNVTLYTNSQNPVGLRDLCSRDQIQTELQTLFQKSYRYFYERKRGELQVIYPTAEMKRKVLGDNWKERIVNNEKAAQAYLAFFLDKPAQAKSSKRKLFVKGDDGFYDYIFSEALIGENLLMTYKLLCYVQEMAKQYVMKYENAEELKHKERADLYRYDFVLHSDFFFLNLFKDYLRNEGHSFDVKDATRIIGMIESNDANIGKIYKEILELLCEIVSSKRKKDKTYYNAKFFKNESSISSMREFLHDDKCLEFIKTM